MAKKLGFQKVGDLIDAVRELMANISDAGQDVDEKGRLFPDVKKVKQALRAIDRGC